MKAILIITVFFWGDVPSKTIEITTHSEVCSQELILSHTQGLKKMLSSGLAEHPWKAIKSECVLQEQ
jgi:hypothetical protein